MLTSAVITLLLIIWCNASPPAVHNRTVLPLDKCSDDYSYTIESYTTNGRPCVSDCKSGHCVASWTTCEACTPGTKPAPTYFTSRKREPAYSKCLSRCGNFGEETSWCVVNNVGRKWDNCNDDTENRKISVAFTLRFGPCRTECDTYGKNYLWCWTWWNGVENWDYCEPEKRIFNRGKTIYGKECRDECMKRDGHEHYTCLDSQREMRPCAPPAEYYSN